MTIKIKQHKDTEAELKRLLFEAMPYIEKAAEDAESDHDATDDYSDYERMHDALMLLAQIKEVLGLENDLSYFEVHSVDIVRGGMLVGSYKARGSNDQDWDASGGTFKIMLMDSDKEEKTK